MTTLVVMPGIDGSGALFSGLERAAPPELSLAFLRYPDDGPQDYAALRARVAPQLAARSGPYALVAESFSGPLALRIAADHPPGLEAVVLVNSFVAAPLETHAAALASRALAAVGSPLLGRLGSPPPALLRRFLLGDDAPDPLVAQLRAVLRTVPQRTLVARLRSVLAANETQAYLHTQLPMFYLRGNQDRLVGEHALQTLIRLRPGLQLHRIDGPHLLLERRPERCMEVLQHCLNQRA